MLNNDICRKVYKQEDINQQNYKIKILNRSNLKQWGRRYYLESCFFRFVKLNKN